MTSHSLCFRRAVSLVALSLFTVTSVGLLHTIRRSRLPLLILSSLLLLRVASRITTVAARRLPTCALRMGNRTATMSSSAAPTATAAATTATAAAALPRTEEEWKAKLTRDEFRVLRQKDTEPGDNRGYTKSKEKGTYLCKACDAPLYSADTKFDSGCGWPAFWQG